MGRNLLLPKVLAFGTDGSGLPPKLFPRVAHSEKAMDQAPSLSNSPARVHEEHDSEHSHSSQKEIHDAKHLASPRALEAVDSLLTLHRCDTETPVSPGGVMTSISFADENIKSPDNFGRNRERSLDISPPQFESQSPTTGATLSQPAAQLFQGAAGSKGKEKDQSSSTRSAQRTLPFSEAATPGILGLKRTRETQRIFQQRVFLLTPPNPQLTYKYRVEIIMADGAEAGPNSVLQSRQEEEALSDAAWEQIQTQDSALDASVIAMAEAIHSVHISSGGPRDPNPVMRANCSVHLQRRFTQVRFLHE